MNKINSVNNLKNSENTFFHYNIFNKKKNEKIPQINLPTQQC